MAITIKNTKSQTVLTLDDKANNTLGMLTFVGKGTPGFVQILNNNFVMLLEKFANETPPTNPVLGQIWVNTALSTVNVYAGKNSNNVDIWESNIERLDGMSLSQLIEYFLSGIDTSMKLSTAGGIVTGSMDINSGITLTGNILPFDNEVQELGSLTNRFKEIYLSENGIVLGADSSNLKMGPSNFVYTVKADEESVENIPAGAIILHQLTGECIIKKATGKFDKSNTTFRTLANDKQNSAGIGGNRFAFMGDVGIVAGGYDANRGKIASMEKFNFKTPSNGSTFGNLTYSRYHGGSAMSDTNKLVFPGGYSGSSNDKNMDYINVSTLGNATFFGSMGFSNYGCSGVSDGTRGIVNSGYDYLTGKGHHWNALYITIQTPNNGLSFGSIKNGYMGTGVSSGTRAIFGGYSPSGWDNSLSYVTFRSPTNGTSFGNLRQTYGYYLSSASDLIRGVFSGGWGTTKMEYIVMSTLSNSMDFGNIYATQMYGFGMGNGTKAMFGGGWNNSIGYIKTTETVNISVPSNASFFGNLTTNRMYGPQAGTGN